jgi:hypothetical protein
MYARNHTHTSNKQAGMLDSSERQTHSQSAEHRRQLRSVAQSNETSTLQSDVCQK